MSANLDKSLDELVSRRPTGRRQNRRAATKPSVGGVKKSTKAAPKQPIHPVHATPAASKKIHVSGLPVDVTEGMIKDYFSKSAGPVSRVELNYNRDGTSRGAAEVTFRNPSHAATAAKELNGLRVEGRSMKIEIILNPSLAPVAKPLAERIAQKAHPKPATAAPKAKKDTKNTATTEKGNRRGNRAAGARGRNPGRGKPKTVEELDAEMVDYFSTDAPPAEAAPVNGNAPQVNGNQDIGMNDEIS